MNHDRATKNKNAKPLESETLYIPPEVEVCLFGLEDDLGQFLKHELMMRKIPNFSPMQKLFSPLNGQALLHLADGLRPRAFLNCIDDPKIIVNLCECCVKYSTRFIHMGKKQTDIPELFAIHNFSCIKYDEVEVKMVKYVMDHLDHIVGFHEYKNHDFVAAPKNLYGSRLDKYKE